MLLRTKLHGKTYEFLETGGFDTPFAIPAQGYSTTAVKMNLSFFPLSSFRRRSTQAFIIHPLW
jgi:hypothetical protein